MLLRDPGFSLVSLLMLWLGIGASTAAFSVMDAVLVRMPPVSNPSDLFRVVPAGASADAATGAECSFTAFERMKSQTGRWPI